jgi:hypothetical protein
MIRMESVERNEIHCIRNNLSFQPYGLGHNETTRFKTAYFS